MKDTVSTPEMHAEKSVQPLAPVALRVRPGRVLVLSSYMGETQRETDGEKNGERWVKVGVDGVARDFNK